MKTITIDSHTMNKYCSLLRVKYFSKVIFSLKTTLVVVLLLSNFILKAQISLAFPVPRAVIQRNNSNQASLNIAGRIKQKVDKIEARLVPRTEQSRLDTIVATPWQIVQLNPVNFFSGTISVKGGWYNLQMRAIKDDVTVIDTLIVQRVGIGEVFVYVGHSNAQGGAYGQTGPDATDDRVSCIAVGREPSCYGTIPFQPATSSDSLWCKYLQSGDAQFLPVLAFSKVTRASGIAPFCPNPWFWSIMGDSLSRKLNVPIMLYGTAFGGTKSDHWHKASKGILFDHGFVKSAIRMPYINLKNVLQLYVPLTGIRGVLCLHGVNERNDAQSEIQFWMQSYIEQSRIDSKIPNLAWMIATDSYLLDHGQYPQPFPLKFEARNAQAFMQSQAHNFVGPDLDMITDNNAGNPISERPDGLHFGNQGLVSAANLWVNSINQNSFLRASSPKLAQSFNVNSLQSGNWQKTENWDCNCFPQKYHSMIVKPGHSIQIDAIKTKPLNLIIQGNINLKNQGVLGF
ncbi:MAG: hypothetical protein RLZZ306_2444 [Bacteroidota bacterium]